MTRRIADLPLASALASPSESSEAQSPEPQSSELTPDSRVRVRMRRPKPQVVVRAGAAPQASKGTSRARWCRSDMPTLIGLDVRQRPDTPPEPDPGRETGWSDPENDWGGETKTLLALKRRPVVLREGTDEALVEAYRRQAQVILDSGLFRPR